MKIKLFGVLMLSSVFAGCVSYGSYKIPLDSVKDRKHELVEIRIGDNLLAHTINGDRLSQALESSFYGRGYNTHFGNFFAEPGQYRIEVSYLDYRSSGGWTRTTRSRGTIPVVFTASPGQLVLICHVAEYEDEKLVSYKPDARVYNYPEDFKGWLHIPFLSRYRHTPAECTGEAPVKGTKISK